MGGLISSPSTPAMPAPAPDTSAAEETQARLDAMERKRRGRSGTIRTSERGLLSENANAAQKKNLLGE